MSPLSRNLLMQWVFMAFVWLANNGMQANGSIVGVKNLLGDNLNLNVYCPHVDGNQHVVPKDETYTVKYEGGVPAPGETPLLCFLSWPNAKHTLDMCEPSKWTGCENVIWEIKQKELCRHRGIPDDYICRDWTD